MTTGACRAHDYEEPMKIAIASLALALVTGSFVACVGSDPEFGAEPAGHADGDAAVVAVESANPGDGAADAFVATDSSGLDDGGADADAADATRPATPKTWTCTTAIAPFAPSTNRATNCSDTTVHVAIAYTARQDALGSVSVTASVTVGSGTPVVGMMTSAAGTPGATNAVDSLLDDVCQSGAAPQSGSFAFSLDKATNTLSIVYSDADLNAGTASYTSACTVM